MTPTQSRAGRPLLGELESFDELSKDVAAGTISRRKALALAGGAALSAALVPFARPAEAGRRRRNRCRNKPNACKSGFNFERVCEPLTPERECFCLKTAPDGRKVCVNVAAGIPCSATNECDNSRDCPGNRVCVSTRGDRCCPLGQRRRICLPRCPRNSKRVGGKGGRTPLLR